MPTVAGGYGARMSQLPNGETPEHIEDLEQTDVSGRLDKDPDEQRNQEDMSDRPDGASPNS